MHLKGYLLLIAISLFIISATANAQENDPKFISVADIHFNPFDGCEKQPKPCVLIDKLNQTSYQDWEGIFEKYGSKDLSGYFTDTNYVLLKSALKELYQIEKKEHHRFVLILGDSLSHHFKGKYLHYTNDRSSSSYKNFVKKTLLFLSYELEKTFPDIDIYPVVGNNDSYTGDYSVIPNNDFFSDTMNTWSVGIKDNQHKNSFRETFATSGYYALTLSDNKQDKLIFLNTVLFSNQVRGKNIKPAAMAQLQWLHNELAMAAKKKQHVILAFHIPIGVDAFATIKNNLGIKQFWKEEYAKQFNQELASFPNVVSAILPGHIHLDLMQWLAPNELAEIPVDFTPSISPIYGNNPSFKVFAYKPSTLELKDAETYQLTLNNVLPRWKEQYQTFSTSPFSGYRA